MAEYRLFYRALLQKRSIILRSLLVEATPYGSKLSSWLLRNLCALICQGNPSATSNMLDIVLSLADIVCGMYVCMYVCVCMFVCMYMALCHVEYAWCCLESCRYCLRYVCVRMSVCISVFVCVYVHDLMPRRICSIERWGAGVETQKNVRGEVGGWGRVPFNEPYAPSLSTIYDGA